MPHVRHTGDLWVFGYGSLMWRPDFPFVERSAATVAGYHRAFCIASTMHRGTRQRPGLVLGLDRGRACAGIAYRVAAKDVAPVLDYLRARELIYGVYRETMLHATFPPGASVGEAPALSYTAERSHPAYIGDMPLACEAAVIRGARGQSGTNLDYLINTVRHLRELGIRERRMERLMGLAAGHAANGREAAEPHRSAARGLVRFWCRRPAPAPVLPVGDQRRFGYRIAVA
ncbi:MAG: gamma-glutamylcyclotransferase [Hyphomicrobiaceae bacterium]